MLINDQMKREIEQDIALNPGMKLSVGIIKDGISEKYLFGKDGQEPYKKYYYEIGSITKTFVGMLAAKAVNEGKISMEDSIAKYIPQLSGGKYYPTIKRLVTHTSGYPSDGEDEYDEHGLIKLGNPYRHINEHQLIETIGRIELDDMDYPVTYSNLGATVAGYALSRAYGRPFNRLMEDLLKDMELNDTYTLAPPRNLEGIREDGSPGEHWVWDEDDVYIAAGYLVSSLDDMLKYALLQMDESNPLIRSCHESRAFVTDVGVRQEIGLFWFLFPPLGLIFHNGGTGCFNCGICVNPEKKVAVVALSNCYTDSANRVISWTRGLSPDK